MDFKKYDEPPVKHIISMIYEDEIERLNVEIERLREVVMLLVAYDEHDEDIQKGAVMWDVLIEAAHVALKEKE